MDCVCWERDANRRFGLINHLQLEDEVYHTNRVLLEEMDADMKSLALDVIFDVGPQAHFLAQDNTRRHLRGIWIPKRTRPRPSSAGRPPEDLG
jgi:hypothetical protein